MTTQYFLHYQKALNWLLYKAHLLPSPSMSNSTLLLQKKCS